MNLYIKGIEMPKKGNPITVLIYPDGMAEWPAGKITGTASEIPPHGRLIDADELIKKAISRSEKMGDMYNCLDKVICAYDIDQAPTIIPASSKHELEGTT